MVDYEAHTAHLLRIAERSGVPIRHKTKTNRDRCLKVCCGSGNRIFQCAMPAISKAGLCRRHHREVLGDEYSDPTINNSSTKYETEFLENCINMNSGTPAMIQPLIREVLAYRKKYGEFK